MAQLPMVVVREGINGSAELAEVPSPTLEPLNLTYLEFIVAEGNLIRERSPVLAVDTYKVSFEVYSPVSGKVVYLNQELDGEGIKVIDDFKNQTNESTYETDCN